MAVAAIADDKAFAEDDEDERREEARSARRLANAQTSQEASDLPPAAIANSRGTDGEAGASPLSHSPDTGGAGSSGYQTQINGGAGASQTNRPL